MATSPRIAVAVIVALAAVMAAGCAASGTPATSGASHAASSGAPSVTGQPVPSFVPRDYVTIDPAGAQRLIVRSTATGAVVAAVSAPRGPAWALARIDLAAPVGVVPGIGRVVQHVLQRLPGRPAPFDLPLRRAGVNA